MTELHSSHVAESGEATGAGGMRHTLSLPIFHIRWKPSMIAPTRPILIFVWAVGNQSREPSRERA
jgi:hypothetical protein